MLASSGAVARILIAILLSAMGVLGFNETAFAGEVSTPPRPRSRAPGARPRRKRVGPLRRSTGASTYAMSPAITEEGKVAIARVLDEAALILPGMGCVVSSPDGVLFEHYGQCLAASPDRWLNVVHPPAGKVDVLDKASPIIDRHTIQFFASTTKLLTSASTSL